MREIGTFEDSILDSSAAIRRAAKSIADNMGKLIALIAASVTVAVTFTDVTFLGVFTEQFTSSFLLLITSAYIIYFSLEDAGERWGEKTDEYKEAKERYLFAKGKIRGEDVGELREFLSEYSKEEFEERKRCMMLMLGVSTDDIKAYTEGRIKDKRTIRGIKKILSLAPIRLSPKTILSVARANGKSELENPERGKIPMLFLKLIPSTICMCVTMSVMLTAKDGLTASDILSGIIKLSALPMIGFRGYSEGYTFSKHKSSLWLETKANILETFLEKRENANKSFQNHSI